MEYFLHFLSGTKFSSQTFVCHHEGSIDCDNEETESIRDIIDEETEAINDITNGLTDSKVCLHDLDQSVSGICQQIL